MATASRFIWYDLMTSDVDAAKAFYADVIGWTIEDSGTPGVRYLIASADGRAVAGLMASPPDQAGSPPFWLGHIGVDNVDAAVERFVAGGGTMKKPPADIPGVGRFAVVADPQQATVILFRFDGAPAGDFALGAVGDVGWCELRTSDWSAAFGFYESQFGWTKGYAHDMGPMGVYQTFEVAGAQTGGMMNFTQGPPHWAFYFTVDDIDAAAARVVAHGGQVVAGPHEVPGGSWIVTATDPQGGHFAMVARGRG